MANVEYIIGEVFMNENLPNRYEMIAVFSTEKAIKQMMTYSLDDSMPNKQKACAIALENLFTI